ncbi:hypothetical protein SprV_0200771600 [Sparganum proliferum]
MGVLARKLCFIVLLLHLFFCSASHPHLNGTRLRLPDRRRFIHRDEERHPTIVKNSETDVVEVEAEQKESAKSTVIELPPMDAAVVNDLTQPQMPTFDEFQAMVSDENQQKRRQADSTPREPSYVIEKAGQADPVFAKDVSSHHTSSEPNSSGPSGHSSSSNTDPSSVQSSLPHDGNGSSPEKTGPAEDAATSEPVLSDVRGDGGVAITPPALTDSVILPSSVVESSAGSKEASIPIKQEQNKKQQEAVGAVKPTLRVMRNIAAVECGAKLLKASQSARHAASILVDNNDMYMNQPCASEKWFILETCEPVQLGTIQIANYELFSSRFKTFKVYVSDRFPAKEWELLGTFQAFDVKGLQSFDLKGGSDRLIKYVKFEMLDHYGNEHFCPITMVRLFGLVSDDLDDAAAEAEVEGGRVPEAVPAAAAELRSDQLNEPGFVEETASGQNLEVDPNFSQNAMTASKGPTLGVAPNSEFPEPSVEPGENVLVTDSNPVSESHDHRVGGAQNSVNSSSVQDRTADHVSPSYHRGEPGKNRQKTASSTSTLHERQRRIAGLQPALGFLQMATSFILNVLRSAVGSPPASSSTESGSAPSVGLQSRTQPIGSSLADLTLRNDDFFTVIYLFTSVCPSLGRRQYARAADGLGCLRPPSRPSHQHLDRGLENLALCIRALDRQLQPNILLPFRLRSPHRAWAPCASSVHLLNLTASTLDLTDVGSSTLCLPCLLSAYRNITRTFSEWSSVSAPLGHTYLRRLIRHNRNSLPARFQLSDGLPAFPLFASSRLEGPTSRTATPSTPANNGVAANTEEPSMSPSPSPPQQQSQEEEGEGEFLSIPSSSQPSTAPPSPQLPSTATVVTPSPTEEFVLPASIGGSRKETAYMRLNNKVRQIEANVSVSMRYLQELSQSYKRQTEKLSRSFNLTTAWLQATAKGAEERDMQQQRRIDALEQRLSRLLEVLAERDLIVVSRTAAKANSTESILEIRRKDSDTDQQKSRQFAGTSDSLTGQISTFIWAAFFPPPDSQVTPHLSSPAPSFALLPHPPLGESRDREGDFERFAESNDGGQVHTLRQQPQCPVLSANCRLAEVSNSVCLAVSNATFDFAQRSPHLPKRKTLSWRRQDRSHKGKNRFQWLHYPHFIFDRRWDYGVFIGHLYGFCTQANRHLNAGFSWLLRTIHLNATELALAMAVHLLLAFVAQLFIFRLFSRRILSEIVRQQQQQQQPLFQPEGDQCAHSSVPRQSTYQPINSAAVQTELNTDAFFERLSDAHLTGAYISFPDSKCSSCTPSLLSASFDTTSLIESQSSASASAAGSLLALQRTDASAQPNGSLMLLQPGRITEDQVYRKPSVHSETDDRLDPVHDMNPTDTLLCSSTGSVIPLNAVDREHLPDLSKSGPEFQQKRRLRRLKYKGRKQMALLAS